jgi:dipeptidyl aminopeptidase/acylaminoacyl peptidase
MKLLLAATLLAASTSVFAEPVANRAFTYQDLVRFERVSDPSVSADGKHVAYTLRKTDYEANKGRTSVWVAAIDGKSAPRQIAEKGGANGARFAADGALYFLSARSGSMQVWRVAATGGKTTQVTDLPLDVAAFRLAPDAKAIALAMAVFPDARTLQETKSRLDAKAKTPSAGTLYTRLFIRHWDTWEDGSKNQLFTQKIENGKATGEAIPVTKALLGDAPTKPFGGAEEFSFSPDGKDLYFSLRLANASEAWSTNVDIYRVPADGSAAPVNLTADNPATDTGPTLSPDGKTLAWRAMSRAGFEADRYRILLRDLSTGSTRELAADWDRSAETLEWSADGKTLFTKADDLGQNRLFAVDVASGKVRALTPEGHVEGFALTAQGAVIAHNTLSRPTDLFVLEGTSLRQITQHNRAALQGLQFGRYEQFSFKGWNQETVYGYAVKPVGFEAGKKYPVAFIVHGGPQGSMGNHFHYRWNPQTYAGAGYAVVFIDFHGSTGYGQKFTDSISGDWGGKPFEDLQKGWAHALGQFDWLDGQRAAALGASYGGYMTNWIAGNWPDAFKALVTHCGIFDNRSMGYSTEELWFDEWEMQGTPYEQPANYEEHNPVKLVKNWKTPTLVIHGAKDYRVPLEQGIAAYTALQRRGVPSQFLHFPDENHWVLKPQNSVQWHQSVEAWLKQWL